MPVKAKYIKDLPLKRVLDGSESLLVQDLNGTQQAPLGTIVDEIKQNSQEKIREIESELAQTNAQLSQKLDKNGIVTMSNMGQDVKEAMTGGSVAVVGKDTVLSENIVNGQVTREKTNFYQYSLEGNLVNELSVIKGRGYHFDGRLNETGGMAMITIYKDHLNFVDGNVKISYNRSCDFAFWGKQNEYISGYYWPHVNDNSPAVIKDIPTTAHYVTISFNPSNIGSIVICKSENYVTGLKPIYIDDRLSIKPEQLIGGIDITKIGDFNYNKNGNLINKLTLHKGFYYNIDNGSVVYRAQNVTIPIEDNITYSLNFDTHIAFFDTNGVFIKGYPQGSLSGTENVAHISKENKIIPENATTMSLLIFDEDLERGVLSDRNYFRTDLKPSYIIDGLISTSENTEGTQIKNPLHGKKAVFLGDSWCAGNNESRGTWASRIKANNPTMTVTNYGLHGADWAQCSIHVLDNTERMNTIKEADYIIIEAYTNGLYGETSQLGKPLGEIDEFNYLTLEQINSLPNSYAKDLEKALYRIATECHGKKIGVIFPYKAVAHLSPTNGFVAFRPQVMACCRKYNIPVFDNFDGCNIPSWHEELRRQYYFENDGVHLNAKGYDVITPSIENWMKSL